MTRLARPVAALLVAACFAMTAFSFASLVLPGTELLPDRPNVVDFLTFTAIILAFPLVGSVIVWKRPVNPVGWLFLVIGLGMALVVFSSEYANRAAVTGWALPAATLVAWLGTWAWVVGPAIALPVAITLFPDGRPPGRSWATALVASVLASGIVIGAQAFAPGTLPGYDGAYDNPFAAPGALGRLAVYVVEVGFVLLPLPGLLAVAAVAARFRGSTGAERQQLKWLLYPLTLFAVGLMTAVFVQEAWVWSLALTGLAAVPIAAGVAILRYRLYDIDVVIRRTLVYGALVALLGALYVALMLALQALLATATGGDTVAVALSTLAIAALFGPVRGRVRDAVDRRFYRSRYDARRTLEAFSLRLREQVELEAVGSALGAVAAQSVQPAFVGVWLRRGAIR